MKELLDLLRELVTQVREDIPEEQGSKHLWETVEEAEMLINEMED